MYLILLLLLINLISIYTFKLPDFKPFTIFNGIKNLDESKINSNTKFILFFPGFIHIPNDYKNFLNKFYSTNNYIIDAPNCITIPYNDEFYKYYEYLDNIRSDIKKYNIKNENVIFVGHSRGGLIASNLIRNTEFKNLVLIAPTDFNPAILNKNINVNKLLSIGLSLDYKIPFFPENINYLHFDEYINAKYKKIIRYDNLGHEDLTSSPIKFLCKSNKNLSEVNVLTDDIIKQIVNYF
jgi:esterase/lipase